MKTIQFLAVLFTVTVVAAYFSIQLISVTHSKINITNSCSGIICPDSVKTCPDGLNFTCPNVCINGECTHCEPNCTGHENSCAMVQCPQKVKKCPDGHMATCQSICDINTGKCMICTPDCSGHENATIQCKEMWSCSQWSACINGVQTRDCIDKNNCGTTENKPVEIQKCGNFEVPIPDHILISEVYYDAIGKESDNEWIELFNPTNKILNISGYVIKDNSGSWTIPNGTKIIQGGYIVIARNATSFEKLFNCTPDIGGLTLSLSNTGDMLEIFTPEGKSVDFVAWENYKKGWSLEANEGQSIKRNPINVDTNSPNDWIVEKNPHPGLCSVI